jgi:hypothetical protein
MQESEGYSDRQHSKNNIVMMKSFHGLEAQNLMMAGMEASNLYCIILKICDLKQVRVTTLQFNEFLLVPPK